MILRFEDIMFLESTMTKDAKVAVIILAAGKGTRMKTDLPKVLNRLAGKPMLEYVIDLAEAVNPEKIVVIAGYKSEEVVQAFKDRNVDFVLQKEQLGTGHAVAQAGYALEGFDGDIVILSGDVPLLKAASLLNLLDSHKRTGAKVSIVTSCLENSYGYGRIVRGEGDVVLCIREEKDLKDSERSISEINAGIYCFKKSFLFNSLSKMTNDNSQREYYLTDIIGIAVEEKVKINSVLLQNTREITGINTTEELEKAEEIV